MKYSKLAICILTCGCILSSFSFAQEHQVIDIDQRTAQGDRWVDEQHRNTQKWLSKTSSKIDNWFGDVDPNRPATANLRVIVDTSWNESDGAEIHPRVRGKIRLPTLERKLSIVFGDERLDDEPSKKATTNPIHQNDHKKIDLKQDRKDNTSLALRWSEWSDRLPFDLDIDVGLRSHDNLFTRVKINKDWKLSENVLFSTEQMYRYSTKHKNEIRSFWQLQHLDNATTHTAIQTTFSYRDDKDHDLYWDSALFRQHQFDNYKRLNYGLQSSGFFDSEQNIRREWEFNSWGPFVSWRQPIWRKWFYVQTEVNYLNNKEKNRDHDMGGLLRLEALF